MACTNCGSDHPNNQCLSRVNLRVDGTKLVVYVNGVPGDAVDLSRAVGVGESSTDLKLDLANKRFVYTSEIDVDYISVAGVANLMALGDLGNVSAGLSHTGDILIYDETLGEWQPYTVPTGVITSVVGVDEDGKLVKADAPGGGGGGGGGVSIPVGGQMVWSGPANTIPTGFMRCDGGEISRVVYSALYSLIGTTYGSGNGTTTFNLPNLLDRTVVGVGVQPEFNALGKTSGATQVTLTVDQMPSHAHGVYDPGHAHGTAGHFWQDAGGGGTYNMTAGGNRYARGLVNVQVFPSGTGIGIYSNGGNQAHNNVQPSIAQHWIIRVT